MKTRKYKIKTYDLHTILKYAAAIVRHKQGTDGPSILAALGEWTTPSRRLKHAARKPQTLTDAKKAKRAYKWLLDLALDDTSTRSLGVTLPWYNELGDLKENLARLTSGGSDDVGVGLISGGDLIDVAALFSITLWQEDSEVSEESEYIGELNIRSEFFLKLISTRYIASKDCFVHNVKDRKGNDGVFFSSGPISEFEVQEGPALKQLDCMLVAATPKNHDVSSFTNNKQTRFNRIKILLNVGVPESA